jgi:hypothetical protein
MLLHNEEVRRDFKIYTMVGFMYLKPDIERKDCTV